MSKRFLPTDIGITREDASLAYRELHDRGLIERIEVADSDKRTDRLSVRLVVQGLNDSRHAGQFRAEEFGYPGARIAGQVTAGQEAFVELPKTLASTLGRWFKEPQALTELRDALQAQMGEDRVYIEGAEVKYRDEQPVLLICFRYPFDADLKPIEKELSELAPKWLMDRLVRLTPEV
jgi:DNA-binding transcriptional MocR family regulator